MNYIPNEKEYAESYQPLFNILSTHGLTLLQSEMDEIISAVDEVRKIQTELFQSECDVEGCSIEPSSGGSCWRETGYWDICYIHSREFRDGKPQPTMKQLAIDRENSRNKTTGNLPRVELL